MRSSETDPWAFGFLAGAIVLLIGLVAAGTGCAHLFAPGSPRAVSVQESAAVRIDVFCFGSDPFSGNFTARMSGGSGVVVNPRTIFTAHHVVNCELTGLIRATTASGRRVHLHVDRTWPDDDVARLVVSGQDQLPVHSVLRGSTPDANDPVCSAVGAPFRGRFCGAFDRDVGTRAGNLRFNGLVWKGNSGSGLYDDCGRLVGIVVGGYFDLHGTPLGIGVATSVREEYFE